MREELKNYISLFYGPSAWDEIVRIEGQMRKERKEAIYAAEERKQMILEWLAGGVTIIIGGGVLVGIFWLIGSANGNW